MRKKFNVEEKAKQLNNLVKRVKRLKDQLQKNGCEVTLYLNENIIIVKKRIV